MPELRVILGGGLMQRPGSRYRSFRLPVDRAVPTSVAGQSAFQPPIDSHCYFRQRVLRGMEVELCRSM
jgi:hypothetical protein